MNCAKSAAIFATIIVATSTSAQGPLSDRQVEAIKAVDSAVVRGIGSLAMCESVLMVTNSLVIDTTRAKLIDALKQVFPSDDEAMIRYAAVDRNARVDPPIITDLGICMGFINNATHDVDVGLAMLRTSIPADPH